MNSDHLDFILKNKIYSWLHDIGKIQQSHFEGHRNPSDYENIIKNRWKFTEKNELIEIIEKHENITDFFSEPLLNGIIFSDKIASRIDKSRRDKILQEKVLMYLISRSHPITGNLIPISLDFSNVKKIVMGFLEKLGNYEAPKNLYNALINGIQEKELFQILTKLPSDTQIPLNDHSLFSHLFSTALVNCCLSPYIYFIWHSIKNVLKVTQLKITIFFIELDFFIIDNILNNTKKTHFLQIWKKLLEIFWQTFFKKLELWSYSIKLNDMDFKFFVGYENIIHPSWIFIKQNPKIFSSITKCYLIIPFEIEKSENELFENIRKFMLNVINDLEDQFAFPKESLNEFFNPIIRYNEIKISLEKDNKEKDYQKNFTQIFGEKIRDVLLKINQGYWQNSNIAKINSSNNKGFKICPSCLHNILKEQEEICLTCKQLTENIPGFLIDDCIDSQYNVAYLDITANNFYDWLFGDLQLSLPIPFLNNNFKRTHSIARMFEILQITQKSLNEIELEFENFMTQQNPFKHYHIKFQFESSTIIEQGSGNLLINSKKIPIFIELNKKEKKIELVGILEPDISKYKDYEYQEIKLEQKGKINQIKLQNSVFYKVDDYFIYSQSVPSLKIFLPGAIGPKILPILAKEFQNLTGLSVTSQLIIFDRKYPLPKLKWR